MENAKALHGAIGSINLVRRLNPPPGLAIFLQYGLLQVTCDMMPTSSEYNTVYESRPTLRYPLIVPKQLRSHRASLDKKESDLQNKSSRSIRIKCNKFIDELLDVCLTCRTHYSKIRAPLHSVGGPAPLLTILVGWWER
jgi:hypothetical protein